MNSYRIICIVMGILITLFAGTIVMAQEENTDASPSIIEIAGSGVAADDKPATVCSEDILHASMSSGLVQVNDVFIQVNNAKNYGRVDEYGESMKVQELCDTLNMIPVTQHGNEEISMDDMDETTGRLWFDEENHEYMVFGTDPPEEETPYGDLLTDSLSTKAVKDSAVLWFPGGINNKGILSDHTRCTFDQLQQYAESNGTELKYQDSSSVFETDSYRFGNPYAGVHYTVDISWDDRTVVRFARLF